MSRERCKCDGDCIDALVLRVAALQCELERVTAEKRLLETANRVAGDYIRELKAN